MARCPDHQWVPVRGKWSWAGPGQVGWGAPDRPLSVRRSPLCGLPTARNEPLTFTAPTLRLERFFEPVARDERARLLCNYEMLRADKRRYIKRYVTLRCRDIKISGSGFR